MSTVISRLAGLLLAIALIVAPIAVSSASAEAAESDVCCGCCHPAEIADSSVAHGACCPPTSDEPADTGSPCESDCGQCPCCAIAAPSMLAVLARDGRTLDPLTVTKVLSSSDFLSSRSDEPLLPPPRG